MCFPPTSNWLNLLFSNLQFALIDRQWLQSAIKIELMDGSTWTLIWMCEKQRCLNEKALSPLHQVDKGSGTVLSLVLLLLLLRFLVYVSKFGTCSKSYRKKNSFFLILQSWFVRCVGTVQFVMPMRECHFTFLHNVQYVNTVVGKHQHWWGPDIFSRYTSTCQLC